MPISFSRYLTDHEPLPTPNELRQSLACTAQQKEFIAHSRITIQKILDGEDTRLLAVIGPCSIHDPTSAIEYAARLKQLASSVNDSFFIVMRVHFEKPRTCLGWKGMLYDPLLNGTYDIKKGLQMTRELLLDLADMEIPAAAEFLDPIASPYFSDIISWGSIGARTATSQIHRQMASGLPMPMGIKNSIDGNIDNAIQAILAASQPHACLGIDDNGRAAAIRTLGNSYVHLVMRGGERRPNYDPSSINDALQRLEKANLSPRVLIDCSHDNSNKKYEKQPDVLKSVIHQILEGNRNIIGIIMESHLQAGNQYMTEDPTRLQYGVSLTDSCLDWSSTQHALLWAHAQLSMERVCEIPGAKERFALVK